MKIIYKPWDSNTPEYWMENFLSSFGFNSGKSLPNGVKEVRDYIIEILNNNGISTEINDSTLDEDDNPYQFRLGSSNESPLWLPYKQWVADAIEVLNQNWKEV